jgi:hypothetical protein
VADIQKAYETVTVSLNIDS